MDKIEAYFGFLSSFGWMVYDETSVPDNAAFPRITAEMAIDFFQNSVALTASLWSRSASWTDIDTKMIQIGEYIGDGGIIIPYDGGGIWIKRGTPWAQRMSEASDEMVRRYVLNFEVEFIDSTRKPSAIGTWLYNDTIDLSQNMSFNINFNDNKTRWHINQHALWYEYYGDLPMPLSERIAYVRTYQVVWEGSKEITITGGDDAESPELINYLLANATRAEGE